MNPCSTCRHYHVASMTCRAHPPAVSVILVPQQVSMQQALKGGQQTVMAPTPVSAFPQIPVPDELGCGEWTPTIGSLS